MKNWQELRKELDFTEEDEKIIRIEKELIQTMVSIREEQGLSQTELSEKCKVKQPTLARMEKNVHSPRVDSLLRILTRLGYTLQIVPLGKNK